jgi:hypothetical protein
MSSELGQLPDFFYNQVVESRRKIGNEPHWDFISISELFCRTEYDNEPNLRRNEFGKHMMIPNSPPILNWLSKINKFTIQVKRWTRLIKIMGCNKSNPKSGWHWLPNLQKILKYFMVTNSRIPRLIKHWIQLDNHIKIIIRYRIDIGTHIQCLPINLLRHLKPS